MGKAMARAKKSTNTHQIRLIGGKWRGRKLSFAGDSVARPTGNRIRETLFNWLAPRIEGARCLDLYAGTGALGLEALSRGARHVVFVEQQRSQAHALTENLALLTCHDADVVVADAEDWVENAPASFDIIFLDPPFTAHLLTKLCTLLKERDLLSRSGLCYVEMDAADNSWQAPKGWRSVRMKQAGQVVYGLIELTDD